MIDKLKKILNEDQDPKAIEKITSKLENLLMTQEDIGYIAVQKKPAVTIFPDSIVVTNKRIILCKPKNLGLSMDFIDYTWDDIEASFVKEGILGSDFTFITKTGITHTIDYLPKTQVRKLYTFSKEQLEIVKKPINKTIIEHDLSKNTSTENQKNTEDVARQNELSVIEEIPVSQSGYRDEKQFPDEKEEVDINLAQLSQDELFEKLQNYKKLLDNGLILQSEYDKLKAEIIKYI